MTTVEERLAEIESVLADEHYSHEWRGGYSLRMIPVLIAEIRNLHKLVETYKKSDEEE